MKMTERWEKEGAQAFHFTPSKINFKYNPSGERHTKEETEEFRRMLNDRRKERDSENK